MSKSKEIMKMLHDENFGNREQRQKMMSLLAQLNEIDDPQARKFYKELGKSCTSITQIIIDDIEKVEIGEDELEVKKEEVQSEIVDPELEKKVKLYEQQIRNSSAITYDDSVEPYVFKY